MQEGANFEFKSEFSKSFLKTVSAFANYGGGEILFGVDDSGRIVGIADPIETSLRIENSINDALEPLPTYTIHQEKRQGKNLVRVQVLSGSDTPYYAQGKAYKRSHTATVKVDASELRRLMLKGLNISFEECAAATQSLEFSTLDDALMDKLGLEDVDEKVYRTLGLYTSDQGFNNAAAVLANENGFPGIDIVKFGKTIDEFMDRRIEEHISALKLYDVAIKLFERYYKFELIVGFERKESFLIPDEAFREAVANALVHRDWSVNGDIRISFYGDRVEISSPGGLPYGISEEDYLAGRLSVLRNPIIAEVFAKLGYIEKFGTGIPRIKAAYEGSGLTPRFDISETSITVSLPSVALLGDVSEDERRILELLAKHESLSRSEIEEAVNLGKSKVTRILKELEGKKLIEIAGVGRATRYKL